MIQAMQTKALDAKALQSGTAATGKSTGLTLDPEVMLEGMDFANELTASLAGDLEVKPVTISPEQMLEMPSNLINTIPQPGNPEAVNPKVFDPELTKGVEKLIQPKTTDFSAPTAESMAMGQFSDSAEIISEAGSRQEVFKSELFQNVKPTSKDTLAATEAKPLEQELVSLEDFVAQKSMTNKKSGQHGAYGMNKPVGMQKEAMAFGLAATQVIPENKAALGAETTGQESINSQQFILNMMSEQGQSPRASEAQAPVRVFDMNQIKTDNPNEIMNQISDYIVQAKAAKEPTVNMRVNHEELGLIDITVSKQPVSGPQQDAIAINIGTHSSDGKSFFQQNSKELLGHLSSAGLSVAEFKVETPSQTAKSDFDMNQQGRQGSGSERQFGSEQNQRRHESERRQDLWNLLKDKEAA